MEIRYLKFYEENLEKINGGKYVVPFREDIMEELKGTGKIFPKAYQELMYLAIGNPRIYDSGINNDIFYAQDYQKAVERVLKRHNFSMDRDFWVICELHSGYQFDFFYFNDPDAEDPENPPVYYFNGSDLELGGIASYDHIQKVSDTLEEYITDHAKAKIIEKSYEVGEE